MALVQRFDVTGDEPVLIGEYADWNEAIAAAAADKRAGR